MITPDWPGNPAYAPNPQNPRFCYLDCLLAARPGIGRGIGSVLYERDRVFFECLPDDPGYVDYLKKET